MNNGIKNPKNIINLVSGGSGFLGSHLINRLMKNNQKVICLDNFSTGKKSNISKWLNHPNFELINHDVIEPLKLEQKVDRVWQLARPASPLYYKYDPIQTAKTIFLGTYNMLKLAKNNKSNFLLASSSEVYGDPEVNPQNEGYRGSVNTIGLRSCYEEGKRMAETLCADFKRIHNINVKIMRIFNTYGPAMRSDDGRVISNFIYQALQGKSLTVYGDGSQTRSFCYVDDLIEGMIKLMDSKLYTPVNIGNPEEYKIIELANKIKNLVDPKLKITFLPLSEDDPLKRKPDISKAKNNLQWQPKINLDEGIKYTIHWFKNNYF